MPLDVSVLQTVDASFLQQPVLSLDSSRQPMLPLDMYVRQPVLPLHMSFLQQLFLPLNVYVQQQPLLLLDLLASRLCLLYSSLCCLWTRLF
jgi:hypothetical protein